MKNKTIAKTSTDEMASCLLFALGAFRNKAMFDSKTNTMTTWHAWFKQVLKDTGYGEYVEIREQKAQGTNDEQRP